VELEAYPGSEEQMQTLNETVKTFRSQLASYGVANNAKPTLAVKATNAATHSMLMAEAEVLKSLTKAGELIVLRGDETEPEGCLSGFVSDEITVYVKVIGLIDIKLELNRIAKRQKQLTDLKEKLLKKMQAASYLERVPENVRKADGEKIAGYENELATLEAQTATF